MKGFFFTLLEKMVVARGGDAAWEALVRNADLKTVGGFLGPLHYPDEDLFALIATASRMTGESVSALTRAYGRYIFPELGRMHASFIGPDMTAKSFLLSIDRVVHVEVHKLYPETRLPAFRYEDPAPDRLVILYDSKRRLCDLAVGLIEGTAEFFGEQIVQTHTRCRKHGAPECRFELRFGPVVM